MKTVTLAKACRRRMKGAPMMVADRAAYRMMADGQALEDREFMAAFEKRVGLKPNKKRGRAKPAS